MLLLCLLFEGERSVTELGEFLSLQQTTVSGQLARLRLDGLVTARRDGNVVHYALADARARKLVKLVREIFLIDIDGIARRL